MKLDATDIKILRALQEDATLTAKELGAKVNLSSSPAFERKTKLEKEGVIERYMAVVNPRKAGNGILVLCGIRLKQHGKEYGEAFMNAVADIDEVVECWNTSGDDDFMIKIYVKDMEAYQDFVLNRLGVMDCIGSLHSNFVIGTVKENHGIPVVG